MTQNTLASSDCCVAPAGDYLAKLVVARALAQNGRLKFRQPVPSLQS